MDYNKLTKIVDALRHSTSRLADLKGPIHDIMQDIESLLPERCLDDLIWTDDAYGGTHAEVFPASIEESEHLESLIGKISQLSRDGITARACLRGFDIEFDAPGEFYINISPDYD